MLTNKPIVVHVTSSLEFPKRFFGTHLLVSLVYISMGFAYEELVSGEEFIGRKFGGVHGKARHFVLVLVLVLVFLLLFFFFLFFFCFLNMENGDSHEKIVIKLHM